MSVIYGSNQLQKSVKDFAIQIRDGLINPDFKPIAVWPHEITFENKDLPELTFHIVEG